MKAKKEATDAKKAEDDLKSEYEETRQTLEQNVHNLEDLKLELSEVQGELNNLKECSRKKSEEKSAMLKNMESRFTALQVLSQHLGSSLILYFILLSRRLLFRNKKG